MTLKSSQAKIGNIYFSTRNLYTLDENTSKYCSRILVVHVHATVFFSKAYPACHNIVNGIKPGSDSRKTDNMLPIAQKLYDGALSYLCEMYKLFIQQCGQKYPSP